MNNKSARSGRLGDLFAPLHGCQLRVGSLPSLVVVGFLLAPPAQSQGADSCALAPSLPGFGNFPFDLTGATTDGLGDMLCDLGGGDQIHQDVWFEWTAPGNAFVGVATCFQPLDTKVAVYANGVCPPGPALACDDNGCGPASRFLFQASAGVSYLIRIGTPAAASPTGSGLFLVGNASPANDNCQAPEAIAGEGTFTFDTSFATLDGPAVPGCGSFGPDVWYSWSSPAAGFYRIETCGLTGGQGAILAVYDGLSCPPSAPIDCSDSDCGSDGSVVLIADAPGQSFLIRIAGDIPDVAGSFLIDSAPAPGGTQFQDSTITALGQASVAVVGTQLVVSNIGSSGLDGVSVRLPAGSGCYSAAIPPFDPDVTPAGAFVETRTFGSYGGQTLMTNRMSVVDSGMTIDVFTDFTMSGVTSTNLARQNYCGDVITVTQPAAGGSANFPGGSRGLTECGLTTLPNGMPNQWWTGEDPAGLALAGGTLFLEGDRVEFSVMDGPSLDEYTDVVFLAADVGSFTLQSLVAMTAGQGPPGPVITEIVDGPLDGGQPKWLELQNQSNVPLDMSQFSVAVFPDGALTMAGGISTPFSSVLLQPGEIFVFAWEDAGNTACDPMTTETCFEFVYGFAPDQYDAPTYDGNDAVAIFSGIATGAGSDAPLVDLYGVIGQDGAGEVWDVTDSFVVRNTAYPSPAFEPVDAAIPGADVLDLLAVAEQVAVATNPGVVFDCCQEQVTGVPYCAAATNSTGLTAQIEALGIPCLALNDLTLTVTDLPNTHATFFAGRSQVMLPFGDGFLCVAQNVFRIRPVLPVMNNALTRTVDLVAPPVGFFIGSGTTWNFQCWFRDGMGGPAGFNFSNGVEMMFR